uniref:WH2 domain-containing protein n=1 Tax=Elaeophora elaphi TaxID=1147741 RepID=A0A0R3RH70_9BILA
MSEKGKDAQATKLEKSDKHLNKPIQAIKKLKNHFYKLGKKNKSGATDTVLPIARNTDTTSKTTDASRTEDTSRSLITHSTESIRNPEPLQESIISRIMKPMQSRVINIYKNDDSKPIHNVDLSRGKVTSKSLNLFRNTETIHNAAVDFQTPNTARNTVADIPRNTDIPRMSDTFRVNDLQGDIKMPQNAEILSRNIKEIGKNEEITGKNIDITHGKSLISGEKSPPEMMEQSPQPRTSQSLLMSAEDIKAMKAELPEKTKVEAFSDEAIEQQLASLNQ